jgi:hypothetical protein
VFVGTMGVAVRVGVGVFVGTMGVAVRVGVGVFVGTMGVAVRVGVGVGVGVDWPAAMADVRRQHAAAPRTRGRRRIGLQFCCPAPSESRNCDHAMLVDDHRGESDYSK